MERGDNFLFYQGKLCIFTRKKDRDMEIKRDIYLHKLINNLVCA